MVRNEVRISSSELNASHCLIDHQNHAVTCIVSLAPSSEKRGKIRKNVSLLLLLLQIDIYYNKKILECLLILKKNAIKSQTELFINEVNMQCNLSYFNFQKYSKDFFYYIHLRFNLAQNKG